MPRKKANKKKQITPSVSELTKEIHALKKQFPAYGILKLHHKLRQVKPHWIIGKERLRSTMQQEGLTIGHEMRRFKLVTVGKKKQKKNSQQKTASATGKGNDRTDSTSRKNTDPVDSKTTVEGKKEADATESKQKAAETPAAAPQKPKDSLSSLSGLPPIASPTSKQSSTYPSEDKGDSTQDNASESSLEEFKLELVNEDEEEGDLNESVPAEFLCDITGQIMQEPVVTPEGHSFDKRTLEVWMQQAGQVNPLNGNVLLRKNIRVDTTLMDRIMNWTLENQEDNTGGSDAAKSSETGGEHLYDFS